MVEDQKISLDIESLAKTPAPTESLAPARAEVAKDITEEKSQNTPPVSPKRLPSSRVSSLSLYTNLLIALSDNLRVNDIRFYWYRSYMS